MNKMTPEYAEALAKLAGCQIHREQSRGVEWIVIAGTKGVESVAVWRTFQMSEDDFRTWHLNRAA